jgi:hypothetical protein
MNDKNNEKETSEYYMNCHHRKDIFGKLVGNNVWHKWNCYMATFRGNKRKN